MKRDVFQALADPTRRGILLLLATQAMTPNALADRFDTSRQAVSKHIKILNECGMLKPKKAGREIHYRLNPGKMKEADKWISQFRQLWNDRFSQLDNLLINQKTK
jgi:DNA-binding transcriptional ArsR family regulator